MLCPAVQAAQCPAMQGEQAAAWLQQCHVSLVGLSACPLFLYTCPLFCQDLDPGCAVCLTSPTLLSVASQNGWGATKAARWFRESAAWVVAATMLASDCERAEQSAWKFTKAQALRITQRLPS